MSRSNLREALSDDEFDRLADFLAAAARRR